MTYSEILHREELNQNNIWLYKEGIFLKAYERSAYFVHTRIKDFKLSRRYIKTVNREVISLGFPHQGFEKWMHGYEYIQEGDNLIRCIHHFPFSEVEYHNWRECVHLNPGDKYTPHTAIIEKTPLYKTSYDLFTQIISLSKHISKNVATPLGIRLKELSYKLAYVIKCIYDVDDRMSQIEEAINYCSEIKYLLQVLKDLKEISLDSFALAAERAVSVSKQLYGLREKVKAELHEE